MFIHLCIKQCSIFASSCCLPLWIVCHFDSSERLFHFPFYVSWAFFFAAVAVFLTCPSLSTFHHTSLFVILYFSFLIIYFHFRLFPSTLESDAPDATPSPPHLLINFYSIFYLFFFCKFYWTKFIFYYRFFFLLSSFPYFFSFHLLVLLNSNLRQSRLHYPLLAYQSIYFSFHHLLWPFTLLSSFSFSSPFLKISRFLISSVSFSFLLDA